MWVAIDTGTAWATDSAMALSMPEPVMIPVKAPAASRIAAIITAAPGMSVYPTALQLRRAVVHGQRDCRAEHEQDRRIDDTRDQDGHQEQRE